MFKLEFHVFPNLKKIYIVTDLAYFVKFNRWYGKDGHENVLN